MTQPTNRLDYSFIHSALMRLAQTYTENSNGDRPFSPTWIHPPWNWNIYLYDEVTSTNQVLWEHIDRQETLHQPIVAIAHQQTHGKGQWSRQWLSPPGGLYLSAGLSLDLSVQMKAMLTLSTAWGIAEILARTGIPIRLKWPNDLVVNGKKLGGILIETRLRGDRISRMVIGVGMNWTNSVPDTGISLHSQLISQPDAAIDTLNDVAALVLLGIQMGLERWRQEGNGAIATAYEAVWIHHGQWVTLPTNQNDEAKDTPAKGQIIRVHESGDLVIHIPPVPGQSSKEVLFPPGTIALGYSQ
jgi:BirA family biotin operon repressor/biotin-[acetyl-CoA-carboxylase] ligase